MLCTCPGKEVLPKKEVKAELMSEDYIRGEVRKDVECLPSV
jgi:hypothetical protein